MRRELALFASLAMLPAMIGPLDAQARSMVAPLCNGGSMAIPAAPSESPPGPSQGPCCAKGCHSDNKRKRLDRSQ